MLRIIFKNVDLVILILTIYYIYMIQKVTNKIQRITELYHAKLRFYTFREKLLIGFYILLILSIPLGSYLWAQQTKKAYLSPPAPKTKLSEVQPVTKEIEPLPPQKGVKGISLSNVLSDEEVTSTPQPSTSVTALFGPTLSFKIKIEGRPDNDQSTKLFVGIAEGSVSTNPSFLLSFSIDMPPSGEFGGLSLAGLQTGRLYTAILKGPAQIASSSAFVASPIKATLNSGSPLLLTSGDLNEDNLINKQDYSLAQQSLGSTKDSNDWNENADFNKDGVINTLDLGIIIKNLGKEGASGSWAP